MDANAADVESRPNGHCCVRRQDDESIATQTAEPGRRIITRPEAQCS